jgi:hypothetical protein
MSDNKPITFRPSKDAQDRLEWLLEHHKQEFQGITKADIINRAIIELYKKTIKESK